MSREHVAPSERQEAHRALPLGVHAVSEARRFAEGALHGWAADEDTLSSTLLVVSELVTNAVLYGYGAAILLLRREDDALVVEVSDRSAAMPATRQPHDESEIGRGLHIVAACSRSWGVRPQASGAGKVVWCILPWSEVTA